MQSLYAADSWLSKAESVDTNNHARSNDSARTLFDVVVSLYNNPTGDNDPNNNQADEEQAKYEEVIRYWADAVCEQANGVHKLQKVRVFRNGKQSARADVVWNSSENPRANPAGFGVNGSKIMFGDVFPGSGNKDMLADPEGSGYTLGHEWGHYVLGLYDEYKGGNASVTAAYLPQTGDQPTTPSIMNSQWNAVGGDYQWLNHSTSNNIGDTTKTAQGRVYGKSAWETLIQSTDDDPRSGSATSQPSRTRYSALVGQEPTESDGWVKEELGGASHGCRDSLDIIWMADDLEMQVVIDRSGSMGGSPIANAKQAAQNLVDVVEDGSSALGVVTFASSVSQAHAITAIPDPGSTEKNAIKSTVSSISAGGLTAMYDGAALALTNLASYATSNNTNAAQVVFLLSDGGDNSSSTTQAAVTSAYQNANVPLITFGYGGGAPGGVLSSLASDTGGEFFSSPTNLSEIQNAFLAAQTSISSSVTVSSQVTTVSANGSTNFPFVVDNTLEALTILINYAGSPADMTLELVDSSGAVVPGITFDCQAVSSDTSCVANVNNATINSSGRGAWLVRMTNNASSDIDSNVSISAPSGNGQRGLEVRISALGGNSIAYPEPVVLRTAISQGLPITGVNITAKVTDPQGNTSNVSMNDAGDNGDAIAGDGIYSAVLGYSLNGTYTVKVDIDNNSGTAKFTSEGFQPSHPSVAENGEQATEQSLPEFNTNFMRSSIMQFNVSGVQSDDHQDDPTAACTTLNPDNSNVSGKIDTAGDVDCFSINTTTNTNDLVIRVSDLALGFVTKLEVFKSDGTTKAVSTPLTSENGYGYHVVKVADIDIAGMVITVSHEDDNATTGSYKVSAGDAISSDKVPTVNNTQTGGNSSGGGGFFSLHLVFLSFIFGFVTFLRRKQ